MSSIQPKRVLVTGASGFVAGHCIEELLRNGYAVRGTVRSLAATGKVAHLRARADAVGGALEFAEADLDFDRGWSDAVAGCTYVLHVASPNPPEAPRNEDDLIRPAVDGTLRVLRACAENGAVRRVVLTSSIAAITSGHDNRDHTVYTEADWSVVEACRPYPKSKTLAERAAWAFVEDLPEDRRFELVAVNPGFVIGPLQHPVSATTVEVIRLLMNRAYPASPRLGFAVVDARDIAIAHRLAMESPKAAGNRYICAGEHLWLHDMAAQLADEFNSRGFRVPTGRMPTWLLWTIARFDRTARSALGFVGRRECVTAQKALDELGWTTRPAATSVLDTGRSLVEHGLVRAGR